MSATVHKRTLQNPGEEEEARKKYISTFKVEVLDTNSKAYKDTDMTTMDKDKLSKKVIDMENALSDVLAKDNRELTRDERIKLRVMYLGRQLLTNYSYQKKKQDDRNKNWGFLAKYADKKGKLTKDEVDGARYYVQQANDVTAFPAPVSRMERDNVKDLSRKIEDRIDNETGKADPWIERGLVGEIKTIAKSKSIKKKLHQVRRRMAKDGIFDDDKKFLKAGHFDKYTTKKIVDYMSKHDNKDYSILLDKDELEYIKRCVGRMTDKYVWESTEELIEDGDFFTECVNSLFEMNSDDILNDDIANELNQIADIF